jgi:hypothetical protein
VLITSSKMNTFVAVFSCLLAASQASVLPLAAPLAGTTIVRAPAHDSASFTHHRLGGNFAYAVGTAEAFAHVTPKLGVQRVAVAEHTHVHTPAAIKTVQPAPIITKTFTPQAIIAHQPVYGSEPVIGPVATEVTVHQPVYKTRTYTQTAQVAHTVAAPAVRTVAHVAAAPAIAAPAIAAPAYAAAPAIAAAPIAAHGLAGGYGLGLAGGYGLPAGGLALGALPAAH